MDKDNFNNHYQNKHGEEEEELPLHVIESIIYRYILVGGI